MDRTLVSLLTEEVECATALLGALERETDALETNDPEALNAAGGEKVRWLERLEALESERGLLGTVPEDDPAAAPVWSELLALVARCGERNRRNGALVAARRAHVGRALAILRGETPEAPVYGASGRTGGAAGGPRSLAEA